MEFKLTMEDKMGIHFIELLIRRRKDRLGVDTLENLQAPVPPYTLRLTTEWNISWQYTDILINKPYRLSLTPQKKTTGIKYNNSNITKQWISYKCCHRVEHEN